MKAERIEVVKDWLEPKFVRNIQVFLGFANLYWRVIQDFYKIATSLTSMLKTTGLPNGLASSKNNSSRPAFIRNNSSRPASGKNEGDGEVDGFGSNGAEHAKKSEKSKNQNLAKS